jgi:hypothetical protein
VTMVVSLITPLPVLSLSRCSVAHVLPIYLFTEWQG